MCFNINYLSFLPHKTITNGYMLCLVYRMCLIVVKTSVIVISDHTCIIHLEVGKQVMDHSFVSITANKIRLLMNMLYQTCVGQDNGKTVNQFSTRLMPLRRPESEIS